MILIGKGIGTAESKPSSSFKIGTIQNFAFLMLLITLIDLSGCQPISLSDNNFSPHWGASPKQGALKMDDYIVWGGSVIQGKDNKFYMFASRWPKKLSMRAWVTNSEVVLAVSDKPEGPYEFKQIVLPSREEGYWDGKATHNPNIQYHKGKYILYYIGVTYDFEKPDTIPTREMYEEAWNHKRIGVAFADSPYGPWIRQDRSILEPRDGEWDAAITSNPAPVIHENGSVMLVYKSAPVPYPERNQNQEMRFGVVFADHYLGEYRRKGEVNQIRFTPTDTDVEDPYVWFDGTKYNMLAKCMNHSITGESGAGFIATSSDGLAWQIAENPLAYSKQITYLDGSSETLKKLERPQVLFQDGSPSYVFFACTNSKDEIFNMVRPLNY